MKNWQTILMVDLIALSLGMATTFAFAPYEIFPLAIITQCGLLFLWLKSSAKRAFWLGFIYGLGLFGTGIYWIYHSVYVFGGAPILLASFITGGLFAFLALFPAITGYMLNRYFPHQNKEKIALAFPALWVLIEWFREWIATGFPWLYLGYSQTNSPLKGFAPIFSVYGVSLAVVMTSALLVLSFINYKEKKYFPVYLNLFLILTIWITGFCLSLIPWTKASGKPIEVSLVQGNIPQSVKWSPENLQLSLDRYKAMTKPLLTKNRLIIWPEAAIPMPLSDAIDYINNIDAAAANNGATLILGIPIESTAAKGYLNTLVKLGDGKLQIYSKRRLVPFGEYTPSIPILPRLMEAMKIPMSDMVPGNLQQKPFEMGDLKILPAICYEIAFPDLMNMNDKTIGLILTVSNDAWFGQSVAAAQHLQMAQMRAIEFRRPLVFVSNDGVTAFVAPNGSIISSAPRYQPYVLNGSIQPMNGVTPWMTNGQSLILFILILCLFVAYRANNQVRELQTINNKSLPLTTDTLTNEEK